MAVPVKMARGKESAILSRVPEEGKVWYAYDTKKIYYSDGNKFISMGGNSSIFYGKMVLTETPDSTQKQFVFRPDQIEGNEDDELGIVNMPNVNDLILNIPDGCFYRVIYLEENLESGLMDIITEKLTIAGSGGGAGPGSSSVITFNRITKERFSVLAGADCVIKYSFTAIDSSGEEATDCRAKLYINSVLKDTFEVYQGDNSINVGSYLQAGTNNIIKLEITASLDGSYRTSSKSWKVEAINLQLNWTQNSANTNRADVPFTISWEAMGAIEKTVYILIDNRYEIKTDLASQSNSISTYTINDPLEYGLNHGAHSIALYLEAVIEGVVTKTTPLYKEFIFIEENNSTPILISDFNQTEMSQYDTVAIPLALYNPINSTSTIILRQNSIEVDRIQEVPNNEVQTWYFTPTTSGLQTLSVECGIAEKTFVIDVKELSFGITEVAGAALRLKANEITSNTALQNWSYKYGSENITLSFSDNFDWVNGGIKSEYDENNNVRQYIAVKAGTSITINHKPFAASDPYLTGRNLKAIFKITNCRDYDANAISCFNNGVGFNINAQQAIYSPVNDSNNLVTPYCENSYIEYEYDLWDASDKKLQLIMGWLDGVPCGVKVYSSTGVWTQKDATGITIGSEDCDVQLYLLKIYNRHLQDYEHLNNFIMDALNAQEMLKRFKRNDILDNRSEIDYKKLAKANPGCWVSVYDIDHMTTDKKSDIVTGCTYQLYQGSDQPTITANNVSMKVQGTSSAKYGLAAFNVDAEFNDGFLDRGDPSKPLAKWAMTPNSIPCNYYNTKVNVASCEGANNAINAEWYNRFQPYICEYRKKNLLARDTMEFHPGVMFVLDRNKTTDANGVKDNVFKDTLGYINNPYPKLYAVCNMGNAKKNKDVFHDKTNPKECCIEVTDNQNEGQWMIEAVGFTTDENGKAAEKVYLDNIDSAENFMYWSTSMSDVLYDVRYESNDGENGASHRRNFFRLVKWMADSNPKGATNEALPSEVTYGSYTFKGFNNEGVLKGTTISSYSGTYTADTYRYRMAKMLSECEDYLIMDSIVFHYLFIERHSMVDNVAKNTFWSTEDGLHWSLIKDYDNDTADGNDNEGKLTLTYGIEVLDTKPNTQNEHYFNATQSVWLNFIDGLMPARQKMYEELNSKGAWSANSYLKAFEEWQSVIPERCWIEDYYRKHIRPLKIYNEDMYLPMLDGGKKTHQRKQYEIYQEAYMETEYDIGIGKNDDTFYIRANGQALQGKTIPVKTYSDCYVKLDAGQTSTKQRVKRNEICEIAIPINDTNDATCYFTPGKYFTYIGDVSKLVPKSISISACEKLREFSLDVSEDTPNNTLDRLTFGNNILLEKVTIRNCKTITNDLDLSKLSSLKELYLKGSGYSSIILPNNAPIESLELNACSSLFMQNMYNLKELKFEDVSNLTSLYLDNIDNNPNKDINSKTLLKKLQTSPKFSQYMLKNVNWIAKASDLDEVKNNELTLLELLSKKEPRRYINDRWESSSKAESLTGTYNIDENLVTNSDDSIEIYEKYVATKDGFSALNLEFNGEAALYDIIIKNGDGSVLWSRKLKKGQLLNQEFFAIGSDGAAFDISRVKKAPTLSEEYDFNGFWIVNGDEDNPCGSSSGIPNYTSEITSNLIFEPQFISQRRRFSVKFYNGKTLLEERFAYYKDKLYTIAAGIIPFKDDSELSHDKTYGFEGFTFIESSNTALNSEFIITSDQSFYAVFKEKYVYENVHHDWFLGEDYVFVDEETGENINGSKVWLNPDYNFEDNKLTIPEKYNDKPVIAIQFNKIQTFKKVFLERGLDASLKSIEGNTFLNWTNLKYYQFNNNLRFIGINAFRQTNLEIYDYDNQINSNNKKCLLLGGKNIYHICSYAFNQCFYDSEPTELYLSDSLVVLDRMAISNNDTKLVDLYIGSALSKSKLDLEIDLSSVEDYERVRNNSGFTIKIYFYTNKYNSIDDNITINNGQQLKLAEILKAESITLIGGS